MRLTEAVVAPAPVVDARRWDAAVEGIPRVLAGLAAARAGGGRVRLTAHDVRNVLGGGVGSGCADEPFAWSVRTARRPLGLAALDALLFGDASTPADAVRRVVAAASQRAGGGERPPSRLDHWLAGLAPAGRAAVGAATVTWATRLWCALDWDALPTPLVIGRDRWWDSPGPVPLSLRSRAEVRSGTGHLVVLTGPRRSTARHELSLVALVEALREPAGQPPKPVVGWWPDSGHHIRIDPDPAVLDMGLAAVAAVLRGRRAEAA